MADEKQPFIEGLSLVGFHIKRDFEQRVDAEGKTTFVEKKPVMDPAVHLFIQLPGAGERIEVEIGYPEFIQKIQPRIFDAINKSKAKDWGLR